jgi:hypothetical protein
MKVYETTILRRRQTRETEEYNRKKQRIKEQNIIRQLKIPGTGRIILNKVFHTHTHTHTLHGSTSLSQRQQDMEQVANTQIYTIFSVKVLQTF